MHVAARSLILDPVCQHPILVVDPHDLVPSHRNVERVLLQWQICVRLGELAATVSTARAWPLGRVCVGLGSLLLDEHDAAHEVLVLTLLLHVCQHLVVGFLSAK